MIIEPRTIFFDVPTLGEEATHKLALYEWSDGDNFGGKETVFCTHGLTRNGRDFDVLASALSADYRVFSIDIAGRGKSQWHSNPVHYNYGEYIADISYIIQKFGLTNIHWIGTSMGGIIGMMLANSFPKLLRTLTLNDIGCLIPAEGLKRISAYVGSTTNFESRALAEVELRRRCAPYGIAGENNWQNLFIHSIENLADGRTRLAYDPAISQSLSTADKKIEDVNLWALWDGTKTIPTLLIRGMESDLLTHQTAITMEQSHPDFSLLEIDNAGHAPALMDDLQINAIRRWMQSH